MDVLVAADPILADAPRLAVNIQNAHSHKLACFYNIARVQKVTLG